MSSAMSRLTRILSAAFGLMGFGDAVREGIESPAPEHESVRPEQPAEIMDPGHELVFVREHVIREAIRATMGPMTIETSEHVTGRPSPDGAAIAKTTGE